mmetsp:Transcript_41305/g.127614  ORF Transcript_41305/g.127614 Transcript_41305/m.127614 type:complete len:414 (-) Transcript_41305:513-1754(-)
MRRIALTRPSLASTALVTSAPAPVSPAAASCEAAAAAAETAAADSAATRAAFPRHAWEASARWNASAAAAPSNAAGFAPPTATMAAGVASKRDDALACISRTMAPRSSRAVSTPLSEVSSAATAVGISDGVTGEVANSPAGPKAARPVRRRWYRAHEIARVHALCAAAARTALASVPSRAACACCSIAAVGTSNATTSAAIAAIGPGLRAPAKCGRVPRRSRVQPPTVLRGSAAAKMTPRMPVAPAAIAMVCSAASAASCEATEAYATRWLSGPTTSVTMAAGPSRTRAGSVVGSRPRRAAPAVGVRPSTQKAVDSVVARAELCRSASAAVAASPLPAAECSVATLAFTEASVPAARSAWWTLATSATASPLAAKRATKTSGMNCARWSRTIPAMRRPPDWPASRSAEFTPTA